jgi:molybdenum cofactor cytidylyltransferase
MIAAVVLAAGFSRRMGSPKLALPWGNTTVLGQVLQVLRAAGVDETIAVTGAQRKVVETICAGEATRTVHNPAYQTGDMLSSLQAGLQALAPTTPAALVVLGDQPRIQAAVVQGVMRQHAEQGASLVVPSYLRRRGHPWLLGSKWWAEVLEMRPPTTLRDFLRRHSNDTLYLDVGDDSIIDDIDTREDYLKSRP